MTWIQSGLITAADYNTFVGGDPTTAANTLNTVWATGGGSAGYGQTPLANVVVGTSVTAVHWGNSANGLGLMGKIANCGTHQASSLGAMVAAVPGGTILFQTPIANAIPVTANNLAIIYTTGNRLGAVSQGGTVANSNARSTTWTTQTLFTHTVTFANGDATRYFFNSGGQIKITAAHANNTAGINALLANLAANIGTVVLSAPITSSVLIATVPYSGVTKIGGGAPAPTTLATNNGYYTWSTTNTAAFTQTCNLSAAPTSYANTYIAINVKTNGAVGTNGDVGNVITIYTLWDEVPDGLTAGTGTTTTVTAVAPETTNLTNSWGTITVTGTYV